MWSGSEIPRADWPTFEFSALKPSAVGPASSNDNDPSFISSGEKKQQLKRAVINICVGKRFFIEIV